MPKLIQNIENKIIDTSRTILFEKGYDKLSMREIASRCGIAVGTIYNYFEEKDEIIRRITIQDWRTTVSNIKQLNSSDNISFKEGFINIYTNVLAFRSKYHSCWARCKAYSQMRQTNLVYHPAFTNEIAGLVINILPDSISVQDKAPLSIMLAELIIASATHDNVDEKLIKTFISYLNFS